MRLEKKEKELLKSLEKGEWKTVKNFKTEKKRVEKIARETIRKNKNMNVRISEQDLNALKERAFEEGLPYQTLVTSIIHKYLNGRFVERSR